MAKDYYQILGISKDASVDDIKKAYRKLAMQHHPDQGGDAEKFKEINEAYQVLGDAQKRQQYDQFGSAGPGGGFGGGGFEGFSNMGGFSDLGDIFESFFGGGFSQQSQPQTGPVRGEDEEAVLTVDFMTAVFGGEEQVEIVLLDQCATCKGDGAAPGAKIVTCSTCSGTGQVRRNQRSIFGNVTTASVCHECHGKGKIPEKYCPDCAGHGRVKKSTKLKVKIPAGIDTGTTLKLQGKGHAGLRGGPHGDLYVRMNVRASRKFERHGYDIHTSLDIQIPQAVLGDEVEIETVHGVKKLVIPAGIESGKKIRLARSGVPKIGSSEVGDHIVTVRVLIPKKLSRKEQELFMELASEAKITLTPSKKKGLFS
ncbi:molecular chaperone DnaJ [Candidatus Gracilibacteria bacterium CG17_big_fil_post_rev_8_21_14_2_50_48_13]|nr:MAG: molecular chaperone DnaJ [Candidatus Gracilibacteria bacterium CG17_big_fil_post_rev_8_21_14_2_50_48_13]